MVVERLASTLPPGAGERLVNGDLRQPGRELRSAVELCQVRIRVDVRLLHHILGFVIVTNDRAGGAVHALVVPAHQDFEERRLAFKDARDDLLIGERTEPGHHRQLRRHRDSLPYRVATRQKVTNSRVATCRRAPTLLRGGTTWMLDWSHRSTRFVSHSG